jgi:alpha-beta hydrolase superfamily lysophospholipase
MNETCSNDFIYNTLNQKIHFRKPENITTSDLIIISLHGYGAHGNRPTHKHLNTLASESSISYITLDFSGHGYSEGTKGLVISHNVLLDEVMQLLLELNKTGIQKTFIIQGHSLGGGIALLASNILGNNNKNNNKNKKQDTESIVFTPLHI